MSRILIYVLLAIILCLILKYIPGLNMSDEKICSIIFIILVIVILLHFLMGNTIDTMESTPKLVMPQALAQDQDQALAQQQMMQQMPLVDDVDYDIDVDAEMDDIDGGINIELQQEMNQDIDMEGQIPTAVPISMPLPITSLYENELENDNQFNYDMIEVGHVNNNPDINGSTIPAKDIPSLICKSKLDNFKRQYNPVPNQPQFYTGKNRTYLDWQNTN